LQLLASRAILLAMAKVPFAVRLRKFRVSKMLSQSDLALGMGISLRTLQGLEYGEQEPRYSTLLKLEKFQESLRAHKYNKKKTLRSAARRNLGKISARIESAQATAGELKGEGEDDSV